MKTFNFVWGILALGIGQTWAAGNAATPQSAGQSIPSDTAYAVIDRGANSRVWEKTTYEQAPDGSVVTKKNHYTELATGLHYQNAQGQWVESQEVIEPFSGGAIARQGRYQVIFANNLISAGSIDQQTPDGKRIRSNVLGLRYFDSATGSSALIAQVKDSQGQLISSNQVLYPDAFVGVKADVRYTYRRGSFEQDIILRGQPPTPESFGLNSQTTDLQVMTEFVNPPEAVVKPAQRKTTGQADHSISWGAMRIVHGKAFDLGETANAKALVSVAKQYVKTEGRDILLESVPLGKIRKSLSKLPLQANANDNLPKTASKVMVLPKMQAAKASPRPMKLAAVAMPRFGYVLDYVEINSDQDWFTFQADNTYYISAEAHFSDDTIFEGGTVIKFATNGQIDVDNMVCKTAPYRPAIFTSKDDDTVGQHITGSTGTPSTGGRGGSGPTYINFNGSASPEYVRMSYAGCGMYSWWPITLRNSQFINCTEAVFDEDGAENIYNCLFTGADIVWEDMDVSQSFNFENVTVDNCGTLLEATNTSGYSGLPDLYNNVINSVLTGVGSVGPHSVLSNSVQYASATGVYQTVGGGGYYLASSSTNRNAGTTNIDPELLADLSVKTTYPPIIATNDITTNTVFQPQAQRDSDTPDLGYHYDPLDYVAACVVSNAVITMTNGVAIGYIYSDWSFGAAFFLEGSSTFVSQGAAMLHNTLVHPVFVQEGGGPSWTTNGFSYSQIVSKAMPLNIYQSNTNAVPGIDLQFTTVIFPSWVANAFWSVGFWNISIKDSEIYFSGLEWSPANMPVCSFYNNLFVYPGIWVETFGQFTAHNNLYTGDQNGYAGFQNDGSHSWTNQDNAFDNIQVQMDGVLGNNAYLNGCTMYTEPEPTSITTNLAWQSSWLGDYYQAPDSPLIQAGSTTADLLGLYAFTTQTNQVPETNAIVDIGYHYQSVVPVITSQPTNLAVLWGGTGSFNVSVTGPGPFTYQWYYDGVPLVVGTNHISIITTTAGDSGLAGEYWGDGGPATNAGLACPFSICVDGSGGYYISDYGAAVVRKVDSSGIITTVAGNGSYGYSGDGSYATNACLSVPVGVALDSIGNLYIADEDNSVVRKVDLNGIITTVVGNGSSGNSGDGGMATNATMVNPSGVCVDAANNLYISDYTAHVIRKVDTNGIITTVAGTGSSGYSGDGGQATNAVLHGPNGISIDSAGNLYFADYFNNVIRKVDTNGYIWTVAGNGSHGFSGDGGLATSAGLNWPCGSAVSAAGQLYAVDSNDSVIRTVDTNGIITTVAGIPTEFGYSGDGGAATNALLCWPTGAALDTAGDIYIADCNNSVVREVTSHTLVVTMANGTLTVTGVDGSSAGNLQVVISNAYGSTASSTVTLSTFLSPYGLGGSNVFEVFTPLK